MKMSSKLICIDEFVFSVAIGQSREIQSNPVKFKKVSD